MKENHKPSRWNPWNWLRNCFGGAGVEVIDKMPCHELGLLDLPPEMRNCIFTKLTPVEHRQLKLVCKVLQEDMEQMIGVHAVVDTDLLFDEEPIKKLGISLGLTRPRALKYSDWLRRVIIRKLTIARLDPKTFPFDIPTLLKNPYVLRSLNLSLHSIGEPLEFPKLKQLIGICPNINQLTLLFSPPNIFYHMICIQDLIDEIQDIIFRLPALKDLAVELHYPSFFRSKMLPSGTQPELERKLRRSKNRSYPQLRSFKLKMLELNQYWKLDWKQLLDAQIDLKYVDVGFEKSPIPRKLYDAAIKGKYPHPKYYIKRFSTFPRSENENPRMFYPFTLGK